MPLTAEVAHVAVREPESLSRLLGVQVDPEWPTADLLELLPGYADAAAADPDVLRWGIRLILDRAQTRLFGDVGFKGPPVDGAVELGYGVLTPFRNRGYASEAVQALAEWALARPDVERVVAVCFETNAASRRVLAKAGFARIGQDGDLLEWERVRRG